MIGEWCPRASVTSREREAMVALLDRYFLGVTREGFERDLAEKDFVVRLVDHQGALRGFSTFALVPVELESERLLVVYSGDTIVDRSARGSFALARTWISAVRQAQWELGAHRLWWLLICSSSRTYRFLPVFFRDFVPRPDGETTAPEWRLRDRLAAARYGSRYDPRTGIVRLAQPQPLRPELLQPAADPRDPYGRCFEAQNPGHAAGDELACLTEISDDNFTAAGWRMVRGGKPRPAEEGPSQVVR